MLADTNVRVMQTFFPVGDYIYIFNFCNFDESYQLYLPVVEDIAKRALALSYQQAKYCRSSANCVPANRISEILRERRPPTRHRALRAT